MVTNQGYLFLIFVLDGIIIGFLFDIFRILRRTIKTKDFVTYLEDFLFWILTGIIILYSIFTFNNGEIRLFLFLGIIIGVLLYMLLISFYFIKINVTIINFFKKILSIIINIIHNLFKKIFFKPISFCIINIKKSFKNMMKKISILKKRIKNVKIEN